MYFLSFFFSEKVKNFIKNILSFSIINFLIFTVRPVSSTKYVVVPNSILIESMEILFVVVSLKGTAEIVKTPS